MPLPPRARDIVYAWRPSRTRPGTPTQKIRLDPDPEPTGQTLDTRRSRRLECARRSLDPRRPLAALGGVAALIAIVWAGVGSQPAPQPATRGEATPAPVVVPAPIAIERAPAPVAVTAAAATGGAIDVSKLPDAPPAVIDVKSLPETKATTAAEARRAVQPAVDARRPSRAAPARPRDDDDGDAPAPSRRRVNPYR
jgi:hypothetical protein